MKCGDVYALAKSDPVHGIKLGTPFVDLPAAWRCPGCGVGK